MMVNLFNRLRGWRGIIAVSAFAFFLGACDDIGSNAGKSSPASPTVTFSVSPALVAAGKAATLTWSSTGATACSASGDWSGTKPVSGSAGTGGLKSATNTFMLNCSGPGGSVTRTVYVMASAAGSLSGLDFQGNASTTGTVRFRFLHPLRIYPATYIWRAYPRQQAGYYTAFFWGNDDGKNDLRTFLWTRNGRADSYYGAHPYPDPHPDGRKHHWEIALEQDDYVNGLVVYDRWYTQALRVWADPHGYKHHEFYWDLPYTDREHLVTRTTPPSWGNVNPPVPALTWGDAPWNPGKEVWDGVLRGIQVYSTRLSLQDIMNEVKTPLSTAAGKAGIWYLNLNPTPTDISDKSGAGHEPEWVGPERPLLWKGP